VAREPLPFRDAASIAAVAFVLLVITAAAVAAGLEPLAGAGFVLFAAGLIGGFAIQASMDARDPATRADAALEARERDPNQILARIEAANLGELERTLRAPIASAIGMAGLVLEDAPSPAEHAALTQIRGAGRDLLESLEEERELADLEGGTPTIESAPFDLGRALALAIRAASRPARGRGVTLRLQMGRSVPPRFVGDAGRVERLVRVWIRGFLAASHSETITLAVALRGERQDCAVVRFTLLGPADAPAAGDSQLSESGPQLYGRHDSAPLAARLLEALGGEAVPTAEAGRHALAAFELPLVPARPRTVATSGARLNPN
jgi:hypothetical protein